jgi:hypothetical protein
MSKNKWRLNKSAAILDGEFIILLLLLIRKRKYRIISLSCLDC